MAAVAISIQPARPQEGDILMITRPYRPENSALTASAVTASAILLLAACGSSSTKVAARRRWVAPVWSV